MNNYNNLSFMHPDLKKKYLKLLPLANTQSIYFIITQVGRSKQYQQCLYNQGRLPVDIVNTYRKQLSLPLLKPKENKIVTWTMNSKHILKPYPEYVSKENPESLYSTAFDVAIIKPNTKIVLWDKPDINNNNKNDYEELGIIAESIGLIWGGRFKNPDMPHYQI